MSYGSRSGRAVTSATNPQAHAICDRCGFRYNHVSLHWQYDWRGASMQNIKLLVCDSCMDVPQTQLRAIVVPADPVPITNPRIQDFVTAETNNRYTQGQSIDPVTGIPVPGGDNRITQDDQNRVTQTTGAPNGSLNELPGTDPNAVTFRPIQNVSAGDANVIRITVENTNGMRTGQKIIIAEVGGVTAANGSWVITIVTDETFDLQGSVFSGSYTSGGYAINDPSLPYGFVEVPRTG